MFFFVFQGMIVQLQQLNNLHFQVICFYTLLKIPQLTLKNEPMKLSSFELST